VNLKWRNLSFISYSEELLQLQCDTVPIARNLESCRSKRDRRSSEGGIYSLRKRVVAYWRTSVAQRMTSVVQMVAFVVESVKLTDQRCMLTAQRVSSPVQRMVSVALLIMSVAQDKV
jgi:hypothetical protein